MNDLYTVGKLCSSSFDPAGSKKLAVKGAAAGRAEAPPKHHFRRGYARLGGLRRRGRAARLALAFAFALFALNLARAIGASAPEVVRGAPRADGTREELDVVETSVDVLVALARAAAGITLVLAGAETNGAVGSRQELFLSICWCVSVLALAPPGLGTLNLGTLNLGARSADRVVAFGDALGGAARVSARVSGQARRAAPGFVLRYATRAAAACAAHWCGLLAVKLAPGAYATRAGETKREETKKDR